MCSVLERIVETFPDDTFVRWSGVDAAIIGVETKSMRLIYSVYKIIEELKVQGMSYEEALEWYTYNIECAYIGERTPIHCDVF